MKLWLLRPRDYDGGEPTDPASPWQPWYDKAFGFVVRAATEAEARQMAEAERGTEGGYGWRPLGERVWTSAYWTECIELLPDGPPGVVLCDFRSA